MIKSSIVLAVALSIGVCAAACGGGPTPPPTNGANPPGTGSGTVSASASATIPPAPAADAGTPPAPASDAGSMTATSAFGQQAATGAPLYQKYCAECHDSDGSGISAPAVVGLAKGALPVDPPKDAKDRKTQFKTAFDVGDFVAKMMPPDHKGTLKPEEVWAIMAWDLKANGIDLGGQTLDATVAKTVILRK